MFGLRLTFDFIYRYVVKRPAKVFEACLVAALTAAVASLIMFFDYDCKPLGQDPTKYPVQVSYKVFITNFNSLSSQPLQLLV